MLRNSALRGLREGFLALAEGEIRIILALD
jgi:hypothetical protein